MSWRDGLRPASFRGVAFHVEANSRAGGRRGFTYEFAKSERSLDEDLGRRVTRAQVSGYIVGDDYDAQADDLELALQREGGGLLVLPVMGQAQMRCEFYTRGERRAEGGMATFEMSFVRSSGRGAQPASAENTQAGVRSAADAASDATQLSAGSDADWV